MRGVPLIAAVLVGSALGFGTVGQKKTHTATTFGLRDLFDLWKAKHNKVYSSQASEDDAFETWNEKRKEIQSSAPWLSRYSVFLASYFSWQRRSCACGSAVLGS